jgi:hypothetical protein
MFELATEQQRSFDWYRRRLGYITGSEVHNIMSKGKSSEFSKTAESYFDAKAAERCINQRVYTDDNALQEYLYYNGIYENRAMQYGVMFEDEARQQFAAMLAVRVNAEVGSCRHHTIPYFAASPDGVFSDAAGALVNIEIKVPKEATFASYAARIASAADLKRVKPEYYWQIIAAQSCTNAAYSYFVTYSRFTEPYLHYVCIERNEEEIAALEQRVMAANEQIDALVQILKNA